MKNTTVDKPSLEGKPLVLANSLTDISLAALPDADKGLKGVSGTVELIFTSADGLS